MSQLELTGLVALITGAGSGIGRATAQHLDQLGVELVLVGRDESRLNRTAAMLKKPPLTQVVDVSDISQVNELTGLIGNEYARLDIVVANSGQYTVGEFKLSEIETYRSVVDTNVIGVMNTIAASLELLEESDRADVIITSSVSGHDVLHPEPVYTASKHAIQAFAHSLRVQLIGKSIRVGSIAPGKTLNELWGLSDPAEIEQLHAAGEGLKSEDVAEAIVFMLTRPRSIGVRDLVLLPSGRAI